MTGCIDIHASEDSDDRFLTGTDTAESGGTSGDGGHQSHYDTNDIARTMRGSVDVDEKGGSSSSGGHVFVERAAEDEPASVR